VRLVVDEQRPLITVSAFRFLQCFDTVGSVTGRLSGPQKDPVLFISRVCLLEQLEEEER